MRLKAEAQGSFNPLPAYNHLEQVIERPERLSLLEKTNRKKTKPTTSNLLKLLYSALRKKVFAQIGDLLGSCLAYGMADKTRICLHLKARPQP